MRNLNRIPSLAGRLSALALMSIGAIWVIASVVLPVFEFVLTILSSILLFIPWIIVIGLLIWLVSAVVRR